MLGFSLVGVLVLYGFGRLQQHLPLSLGFPALPADGSWNTAVSFVTNTNWQWYSGEAALGHPMQMAGLTVQNFVSARSAWRSRPRSPAGWRAARASGGSATSSADLVRGVVRVLLPIALVAAVVLVLLGAVQNFAVNAEMKTLADGTQCSPAARSRARRRSRSWAPTVAASTTSTPRTRSRTRRP